MDPSPERPRVALTFDAEHADRPASAGVTERLLDVLRDAGVAATFFVQGRWALSEPSTTARIAAEGHLVGNHSHHHARMTLLTRSGIAQEVQAAGAAISEASGRDPRPWFRCPYGAGSRSARVLNALAASGYVDVNWHVDSRDWAGGSVASVTRRVVAGVEAQGDGAVVLLHGWPASTPDAVRLIIRELPGVDFVRVDALPVLPGRRAAPAPA
ncbi:MAG: polysaccharide deacetylase family protein [Chloroflexota bacterium]